MHPPTRSTKARTERRALVLALLAGASVIAVPLPSVAAAFDLAALTALLAW